MSFTLDDVRNIEGENEDADDAAICLSIQRAINAGMWGMQGSYGRTMMDCIETGRCMLGTKPAQDAYGNRIPARDEVQEGTKGSRSFVASRMGEEWARSMEHADTPATQSQAAK